MRKFAATIFLTFLFAAPASADTVDLSTYYPAPEGEFKKLTVRGHLDAAVNPGDVFEAGGSASPIIQNAKAVFKADGGANSSSARPQAFKIEDRSGGDLLVLDEKGELRLPSPSYSDIYIGKTQKWISQMTARGGLDTSGFYIVSSMNTSSGRTTASCGANDIIISGGCKVVDQCDDVSGDDGTDNRSHYSYPPDLQSWTCGSARCSQNENTAYALCYQITSPS